MQKEHSIINCYLKYNSFLLYINIHASCIFMYKIKINFIYLFVEIHVQSMQTWICGQGASGNLASTCAVINTLTSVLFHIWSVISIICMSGYSLLSEFSSQVLRWRADCCVFSLSVHLSTTQGVWQGRHICV